MFNAADRGNPATWSCLLENVVDGRSVAVGRGSKVRYLAPCVGPRDVRHRLDLHADRLIALADVILKCLDALSLRNPLAAIGVHQRASKSPGLRSLPSYFLDRSRRWVG